jgi:sialate O-acetylesterase
MMLLLNVLIGTIQVTPLLGDHAVVQQGVPIPVWGTADPGAAVSVRLGSDSAALQTQADHTGRFFVALPARAASSTPAVLEVRAGDDVWTASDVLIGEVWLASGQSNMEWRVNGTDSRDAGDAAFTNDAIREFKVPHLFHDDPQADIKGAWAVASPGSTPQFSAVAWNFATMLNEELGVPVGIVNSSWGGSMVEAWTSVEALQHAAERWPHVGASLESWFASRKQGVQDSAAMASTSLDDSNWKETVVPGDWASMGLGDVDGTVFYRVSVWVPEHWAGRSAALHLGPIDDRDVTFWDGHRIGSMDQHDVPREYVVPGELVTPGHHVIAVRATDLHGAGGFFGKKGDVRLFLQDDVKDVIGLAGPWRWQQTSGWNRAPRNTPTVLSNAMIAPLERLPFTGVIWYQGESNAHDPASYAKLFPLMIDDWSARFGRQIPMYFVQLANLDHGRSNWFWPQLREAQRLAIDTDMHRHMAVCFDVGNPRDIHPTDKRTVGRRLGRLALHYEYGQVDIVPCGPQLKHWTAGMQGDRCMLEVFFETHGGALSTSDGQGVRLLEAAGSDGVFRLLSDIELDGSVLRADCAGMDAITAVRYGWRQDPAAANLTGADSLPASPFCDPSTVAAVPTPKNR